MHPIPNEAWDSLWHFLARGVLGVGLLALCLGAYRLGVTVIDFRWYEEPWKWPAFRGALAVIFGAACVLFFLVHR